MAVRKINESTLTAIGNAIRSKTGGSALINPEDMADEINGIPTGGGSELITVSPLVTADNFVNSVNSLKNAVIAEIGDEAFIARHISGEIPRYCLLQLTYIPQRYIPYDSNGWMIMSVRAEYSTPISAGHYGQHRQAREADIANNYSYAISSNSVYAVKEISELYSEYEVTT